MSHLLKLLITIFLGFLIYQALFAPPANKNEVVTFQILPGQSLKQVADVLKEKELIRSKIGFQILAWLKGLSSKIQAGEYQIPSGASLTQILDYLSKGMKNLSEREITIIEGWTIQDIANYLTKEKIISSSDQFLNALKEVDLTKYDFLKDKPKSASLEGYLFPDTYRIYRLASPASIIQKMLENFGQKLTLPLRQEIERQGRTIFDVIRMASIVEAEVPHPEDRPIVAGILWKRLDAGMPLQVDSTLNYVTGNKSRALSAEELKIDSRYNTYKYPGLPPTPICNPGLEAIKAAIYPEDSPYWFFLSDKEGRTIFSKTFEEHQAAKKKYLP